MDMRRIGPAPLDPKVTKQLLDLLSTDDEFRRMFKKDAAAALAMTGYKIGNDETSAAFCLQIRAGERLASKEKILRERVKLEKSLNSIVNFAVPMELMAD